MGVSTCAKSLLGVGLANRPCVLQLFHRSQQRSRLDLFAAAACERLTDQAYSLCQVAGYAQIQPDLGRHDQPRKQAAHRGYQERLIGDTEDDAAIRRAVRANQVGGDRLRALIQAHRTTCRGYEAIHLQERRSAIRCRVTHPLQRALNPNGIGLDQKLPAHRDADVAVAADALTLFPLQNL